MITYIIIDMSSTKQILPTHIINNILKTANLSLRVLQCEVNINERKGNKNTPNKTILIMRRPHPNAIMLRNLSYWNLYRICLEDY